MKLNIHLFYSQSLFGNTFFWFVIEGDIFVVDGIYRSVFQFYIEILDIICIFLHHLKLFIKIVIFIYYLLKKFSYSIWFVFELY